MRKPEFPIVVKRGSATVKVYFTPTRGQDSYTLSYWVAGQRKRPTFSDLQRAKDEAANIAVQLTKGDLDVATLTSADRSEFLRAKQLVGPTGVSLEMAASQFATGVQRLAGVPLAHAIDFYLKRNPLSMVPKSVQEVIDEMLEAKRGDKLSERYLKQLSYDLGKFAGAFNVRISDVTGIDVDAWLRSFKVSPRTRNNLRAAVKTLFSFAKKRKYLPKDNDELDMVTLVKNVGGDIQIFTPRELEEILTAAKPELIPFLAIGAFAGVRHSEIHRLDWADVQMDAGIIEIQAAKAKTASRRTIPILPNLQEWLLPHAQKSGPIAAYLNMTEQLLDLRKAINSRREKRKEVGKFAWKHNGLRHSFISYRVAQTQNVAQVALEAGNSPQMIFRHYRELVRPADAKKWFSIAPVADGKCIQMENAVDERQKAEVKIQHPARA